MAEQLSREAEAFNAGVTARRENLMARGMVGMAGLFVFEPVVGLSTAALYMGVYLAVQLIDAWAFDPISRKGAVSIPRWRKALGCLGVFLTASIFASLSVPMWREGGAAGGIAGLLIVTGGCIHAVMTSGGSRTLQGLTMTPLFVALAATPLWMSATGASVGLVTAAAITCFAFTGFVLAAHSHTQKLATSERKARRESDRRRSEAETAMSDKSTFIAAVGHDLRTPLSAILTGASEMAQSADSSHRSHANLILDAGQMMNRLLDDLLDQARLEAGRMEVEPVVFNLRDLVARACRFWQGQARAKGVRLIVEGGRSLPAWVETDPVRVRQILNNLLSNAVKFTDAGEIRVRLNAWEDEGGGHALTIEIADTGEGMDKAQLGRLFQAFDQTRAGVARSHGGSGLGLWISRGLAELMGGRLIARSTKGEGSAFTLALTLPQAEPPVLAPAMPAKDSYGAGFKPLPEAPVEQSQAAEVEAPGAEQAADEDDDTRPLRVLIVDDHEINRRAVQLILMPLGCDVSQAADGMAALAIAEREAFDIIFMDVRMPELDGRETTRRLRATEGPNQHTPVIAVTADSAPEDVAACAAAGMTWFVAKPLTPAALLGALQSVLSGEASLEGGEAESAAA